MAWMLGTFTVGRPARSPYGLLPVEIWAYAEKVVKASARAVVLRSMSGIMRRGGNPRSAWTACRIGIPCPFGGGIRRSAQRPGLLHLCAGCTEGAHLVRWIACAVG